MCIRAQPCRSETGSFSAFGARSSRTNLTTLTRSLPYHSSHLKNLKMAESTLPRDTYDIKDQRYFDPFWDDFDLADPLVAYDRDILQHLHHLKKEFRRIFEKRHYIFSCLYFLIFDLQKWPCRLLGLGNLRLSKPPALPPSLLDTDNELLGHRARVSSAKRDQFDGLTPPELMDQLVLRVRLRGRTDGGRFDGPRLLYRVQRPNSHTFYNEDVGFCSRRRDPEMGFDEPSKWDFYHHASGYRLSSEGVFETPYISMTSCPTRALNLVPRDEMRSADVFIIDAELLWDTNIRLERTTDIANRHRIKYKGPRSSDRAHYITDTHWVAQHWIPNDCIIRRMRFHRFQEICSKNAIFRGTDYPVHQPISGA